MSTIPAKMGRLEDLRSIIEEDYRRRTPGSEVQAERASQVLPLGVGGIAKWYSPYPVYLAAAGGGHVRDVDGNDYVDVLMGAGPNLLGHRHPTVQERIARQLGDVVQTLAPTPLELELAERLRAHMTYLERIRFTNTGSEAVRTCLRAARAFTGRTAVAKVEGSYHGSDDPFLMSTGSVAGSPLEPEASPESAGVPDYIRDDVLILPPNDAERAVELVEQWADRLAAVVLEPVMFSTGGALETPPHYAAALRRATERHGIVLIFDEVVTCFRMGLGGAPAYLGATPDLSAVGKALGGGMPLAAMGGRADIMEGVLGKGSVEAGRRIFQSGTFTGNPICLVSGLATLEVLEREPVLERIDALGNRFRTGMQAALDRHGLAGHMTGVGSIFQLHLTEGPPRSRREILRGDLERLRLFLLAMVARGVLWPPIHPGMTAFAHEESDIDAAIERSEAVAALIAQYRDA
jgi:glutamate-1-semialdehyde 2,1-aminomutase